MFLAKLNIDIRFINVKNTVKILVTDNQTETTTLASS